MSDRGSEVKREVLGVRLTPDQIEIIDSLVEARLFKTRSEVAFWLISEGLRIIPLEKLSARLKEIRDLSGETMREMQIGMDKAREVLYEAFGEGYVHPLPKAGEIGWGIGLTDLTPIGPMGFDWDKIQLVMRGGSIRLPREKGPYSKEEKEIMRAALQSDLKRMAEDPNNERAPLLKKRLEYALTETEQRSE